MEETEKRVIYINTEPDLSKLPTHEKIRLEIVSKFKDIEAYIDMYKKISDSQDHSKIIEKHKYRDKIEVGLTECHTKLKELTQEYNSMKKKKKLTQNQSSMLDNMKKCYELLKVI